MNKNTDHEIDGNNRQFKTLTIQGEHYKTLYTEKFDNRKNWTRPDVKKITSILPGTILKLNTNKGDMVEKDTIMLVLEAMKMQNTYYFPFSGKIKEVYVKHGDKVPKGFLMLEYE